MPFSIFIIFYGIQGLYLIIQGADKEDFGAIKRLQADLISFTMYKYFRSYVT